jgi:uncharacterized ion transporter superfamily protein YfcC
MFSSFPSAPTLLLIIAFFVALSTWLIPSGKFDEISYQKGLNTFLVQSEKGSHEFSATQEVLDSFQVKIPLQKFKDGSIWKPIAIPGTYHVIDSKPQGIVSFLKSPIQGMMGAFDVILFVLIIGGFIGIVQFSGAFDAGIGSLATLLKGREPLLIVFVSTLIAIGGTTFGLAEETIAFYPILLPVFLAARYDVIVALATIYLGSSVGTMISTVNPFSAIIASNAAGISWTEGLGTRAIFLIVAQFVTMAYVIRYAERVRKNPELSIVSGQREIHQNMYGNKSEQLITLNGSRTIILLLFLGSFLSMILGVSLWQWWFTEMTVLFLCSSVLIGIFSRIGEKKFIDQFVKGASELLNVALIIGIARGITWLMDEGQISSTLLYWASESVKDVPSWLFINLLLFVYAFLSFFIPSSSGLAVMSMPVMAPLADVVEIDRYLVVNAYQYGMGLMAFITPTGLILASLAMVQVSYDKWLKFVIPLLIMITLLTMIVLTIEVLF